MRIGIDLGGTKTEAIALADDGSILARRRVSTPRGNYVATIQTIVDLVATLESELSCIGTVGIGIPGAISPASGQVKNANSTWIISQPLDKDLSRALSRPVRIANDANCFALSEAVDGAAQGASVVFGAIIGTGTGGGIVINGHPLVGQNAIAGEWGHSPLPWPNESELQGPPCYCGKRGCIETWLSGPALVRDHGIQGATAEQIASLAEEGDSTALASIQRYENRLARSLATVINLLDPDIVVLGGGLSNISRLYENVPRLWGDYVFSDQVNTQLMPPCHGDSSGVRGAAWLWGQSN